MAYNAQLYLKPYQKTHLRTRLLTSVSYSQAHRFHFPETFPDAENPVEVMRRVKNVAFTPEVVAYMEMSFNKRPDIQVWTQRISEDSLGYEISRYMPREKRVQYRNIGELILRYDPQSNCYILQDILHNGVSLRHITCGASATFYLGR